MGKPRGAGNGNGGAAVAAAPPAAAVAAPDHAKSDSPVLELLLKRRRALVKKIGSIEETAAKKATGAALNELEEAKLASALLRGRARASLLTRVTTRQGKESVSAVIKELSEIIEKLPAAIAEERALAVKPAEAAAAEKKSLPADAATSGAAPEVAEDSVATAHAETAPEQPAAPARTGRQRKR